MMEEHLREFRPVPAPAGLKDRVLAAARTAPRSRLIDRLWTRRTWGALAAGTLLAAGLYIVSLRPVRIDMARRALDDASRKLPVLAKEWSKETPPRAMVVRLAGPHALDLEVLR
jgi:hypothetical protein